MADSLGTTALPAFLGRAAERCKEAAAVYFETEKPALRLQRQVLLAVAALEGCAAQQELETSDVRLVRDVVSDAAAACRTGRPNRSLAVVVARLDEVVAACDDALGAVDSARKTSPWRRFLFDDADVQVARTGRIWRVRTRSGRAEDKLLDVALGSLLRVSNHRLGELTVQILDWYAHDDLGAVTRPPHRR